MKKGAAVFTIFIAFIFVLSIISTLFFYFSLSSEAKEDIGFSVFSRINLGDLFVDDYDLYIPEIPEPPDIPNIPNSSNAKDGSLYNDSGTLVQTKTISLEGIKEIKIEGNACKLNIEKDTTVTELTVDFSYSYKTSAQPKFVLQKSTGNSDEIIVKIAEKAKFFNFGYGSRRVSINVKIPASYYNDLDISANASTCTFKNLTEFNEIDLDLNAGTLEASTITAKNLNLTGNACEITFKSLTASIDGEFNASSVDFYIDELKPIEFEGNVTEVKIYIPENSSADVNLHGTALSLNSDFDLSHNNRHASASLTGKIGSGTHSIKGGFNAGSISLLKNSHDHA